MTQLLSYFLLTLAVITAVGVVRSRNLFAAVMLMGIFSLLMAAVFLLLDAADVALTEAAVGAGISTVLLLSALALTLLLFALPDEEIRTGPRFEHIGEILAGHDRAGVAPGVLLPHDIGGHTHREGRLGLGVNGGRIAPLIGELHLATE